MKFQKIIALICISSLLACCAGRAANPVTVNQFGDEKKSCKAIQSELRTIENRIQHLIPESNKTGRNVTLGIIGLIVWPAWLFMDLTTSEKEEINAYRSRHDRLVAIAETKNCTVQSEHT